MADRSRAYFPLRANSGSLVAGAGVATIRRRIKRAGLLHDEVLLESGSWSLFTLETGEVSIWQPHFYRPEPTWQSARARGKGTSGTLRLSRRSRETGEETTYDHKTTMHWAPTFEPFRRELPRGVGWIGFGHVDDPEPQTEAAAASLVPDDVDAELEPGFPDRFVRHFAIRNTTLDLLIGTAVGAAVACDRRHDQVLQAYMRAGRARVLAGELALSITVPTELTWAEALDLRADKGLREYRAVLRDVEDEARESTDSLRALESRIRERYGAKLAAAEARRPSVRSRVGTSAIGVTVGHVAGALVGLPIVGDAVGLAAGLGLSEAAQKLVRPKWLSVHYRVNRTR